MNQTLYLPIEVKNRELEGKTLLAVRAAERGMSSVIGSMGMIKRLLPYLPRGIYMSKDVYKRRQAEFKRIRAQGHELVSWDEEGLIFRSRKIYLSRSVAKESLEQCSRFFTWGDYQAEILREIVDETFPLVSVGNPRFDLLRPEHRGKYADEVNILLERHGSFVLVNTNFGRANNIKSEDELLEILRSHSTNFDEESERNFYTFGDLDRRMFAAFLEMIPRLAESLPDGVDLIIRPHPIEKLETYEEKFGGNPRIKVAREGGVTAWLLAAKLLVHNSCTTGVESLLLGKPPVAYDPFGDDGWEINLPNTVSVRTETVDDVCRTVREMLDGSTDEILAECESRATRYIASVGGTPACDTILETLQQLILERQLSSGKRFLSGGIVYILGTIGPLVKRFLRALRGVKIHAYDAAKFSGLSKDDLLRAVRLLDAQDRVCVSRVARDVYRIDPV